MRLIKQANFHQIPANKPAHTHAIKAKLDQYSTQTALSLNNESLTSINYAQNASDEKRVRLRKYLREQKNIRVGSATSIFHRFTQGNSGSVPSPPFYREVNDSFH